MSDEQQVENSTDQKQTEKVVPEMTLLDVENLYTSALEVQKNACRRVDSQEINSLPLDLDLELANLISKLRKWVQPFSDSKNRIAESLGFMVNGNTYVPQKKYSDEEREANFVLLSKELALANEKPFEHIDELKKIIPLPSFTKDRMKEGNVYFKDTPNRQYFLEYCIKQSDKF